MKSINTPPPFASRWISALVLCALVPVTLALVSAKVAISGTVVGKDGAPAQKVPVRLVKPVSPDVVGQSSGIFQRVAPGMLLQKSGKGVDEETEKTVATTVTDADGKFKLPEQPAGTYTLLVGNSTSGLTRKFVKLEAGKPVELTITLPR